MSRKEREVMDDSEAQSRLAKIIGVDGKTVGEVQLPEVFESPLRLDVIRRAVIAQQSHRFQPQGRNPMAGKRTTAESFGVGRGISRVPRINEPPLSGQGAFAPGMVGGRLAFPPTTRKKITKRVNRKERRMALMSAIALTGNRESVKGRGHKFDEELELPVVVSDDVERLTRTSDARKLLTTLGVWDDIERVRHNVKIRHGKRKARIGPLIVVSDAYEGRKAFSNMKGTQVVSSKDLSVEHLAPGTQPGRLTIWTESAIREISNRKW